MYPRPARSCIPSAAESPGDGGSRRRLGGHLLIARIEIDRVTVSHEKVEATAEALTLSSACDSFEPTPRRPPAVAGAQGQARSVSLVRCV